jgi:hypothetical protein
MFKRGGDVIDSQGTGITSGLDTPRQKYDNGKLVEQLSEIDVSVPESTKKGAFWRGIGEGFANARTLGEGLRGAVVGQQKILAPAEAAAAERKFDLQKTGITGQFEADLQTTIAQMDQDTKIKVANIAHNPENTATGLKIKTLKDQLDSNSITPQEYQRRLNIILTGTNLQKDANTLAAALISSGAASKEDAAKTALEIILTIQSAVRQTQATGGRAGYQLGTTNQGAQPMGMNTQAQPASFSANMQETVKMPEETVTEDVQVRDQLKPSVDMDYAAFRAKMPPEVTDDIVQLLYWNEDAFADFAQIQTQDDVYAFNNKYQVSLVLPMNTEMA